LNSDLKVPKQPGLGNTLWNPSNAFMSAFKEMEPLPQFRATAKLAGFLEAAQ
jgi:hypothetical protein